MRQILHGLLIFLLAATVFAQNKGPSLEDTMGFLTQHLKGQHEGIKWYEPKANPDYGNPWGLTTTIKDASANGCVLTVTTERWGHLTTQTTMEGTHAFTFVYDLSKYVAGSAVIDSEKESRNWPDARQYDDHFPEHYYIMLATVRGQNTPAALFAFQEGGDMPQRLTSAINHAIELCGGKPEAF